MLKEAIEQTGIPKLVGWHDSDANNEDGIVKKAVVSELILESLWKLT